DYADRRRELIREDRAYPELPAPGDPWSYEGRSGPAGYRPPIAAGVGAPDTSFACAMDAEGNAFAATPSDPGLGAPLVGGLGIIVSTRGAQLWTTAGHPSAIAPRKRPRLTPNPALLMKDGRPLMPFGCPGEDAQCQAMVQVVCNIVDFGMNTQAAIEAPRVISRSFPWTFFPHAYEPGVLQVEGRVSRQVRDELVELGHVVRDLPDFSPATAGVCAIRRLDSGALEGGADPRRERNAEVAIDPNVSAGLVGTASTLDYAKRPKVIVSDLDFPTDGHALLAVKDRGAQVEFVRSPDRVRVPLELFERTIDERTAAVCTGQVYFTTGWVQDVAALAELCHRKGALLVVDAYQSIGALPFDIAASGVDYLVGGTLKWLMGGPGIAFLYGRESVARRARPSAVGWWGVQDPFAFDIEHLDYGAAARRFEYGT